MSCCGSSRSIFGRQPLSEMAFRVRRFRRFRGEFPRYVPAAARRRTAERELEKLAKEGRQPAPIVIEGRKIATTFWGDAWCTNLERYSDFANRLGRGRSYVRNGLVIDLQIETGVVTARVSGTDLYTVKITVAPVPKTRWRAICRESAGAIDSVVELLQGQLSKNVMARLCEKGTGLFPAPSEIKMTCTCPDAAIMCKHVAATLYGVGARLDRAPALLFTLRRVNKDDLVSRAVGADLARRRPKQPRKTLAETELSEIFGLDIVAAKPE